MEHLPEGVLQEHEEEPLQEEDYHTELPVEVEEVAGEDAHVEEVYDHPTAVAPFCVVPGHSWTPWRWR